MDRDIVYGSAKGIGEGLGVDGYGVVVGSDELAIGATEGK